VGRPDVVRLALHVQIVRRATALARGQLGGVDFVLREELARRQLEDVEAARNLRTVEEAVVVVDRPVAADDQVGLIDRTAVEVGDFLDVGGVGEIEDRRAALIERLGHDVASRHRHEAAVVRDAVLARGLPRRHLEVAAELQMAVVAGADDIEHRVAAPHRRMNVLAHRLRAAAPFVGEEQLGRVVVERRGVPERERGVGDVIQSLRLGHDARIEQQTVAGAGAAEQLGPRIAGDVVAPGGRVRVGFAGALAAAADAGELTGIGVREDVGVADHRRLFRVLERHLDHIDAVGRRVRRVRIGDTARLLLSRSNPRTA